MIIALQGKTNTGKTNTIKELMRKMPKGTHTTNCGVLTPISQQDNHLKNFHSLEKLLIESVGDIYAVFNYNGIRIGITTQGDKDSYLEKAFELLGICEIYVCAVRTKGSTIDFVKKQDKCCTFIKKQTKFAEKEWVPVNEDDAEIILSIIKKELQK